MDIRTKLIFALVSFSLVSMAILGIFAYKTSASLLQQISVRQLDALAESKKSDLLKVYESWKTQVRLIGSRTQLQMGLRDYQLKADDKLLRRLERILEDASSAAHDVTRVTLIDRSGQQILSVGNEGVPVGDHLIEGQNEINYDVSYTGSFHSVGNEVCVRFYYPLKLDEEDLGAIEVVIEARGLSTITEDYTGLGETGETLAVMRGESDEVVILNSLRHDDRGQMNILDPLKLSADIESVLTGQQQVITHNLRDYRGTSVWSATRFLPGLDWGLIVKVDTEEETAPIRTLRQALIDLALALSAFAVVGGTVLGIYLSGPIQDLASVVHRLRDGDLKLRADIKGDDEVAFLARSLNQLMDEMQAEEQDPHA